jgi:hypothetical protein
MSMCELPTENYNCRQIWSCGSRGFKWLFGGPDPLGGCHPKLQTPLAAADVRGRVATLAGGALAGDVVAAAGPRALAAV